MLVGNNVEALVGLAQMNVLELHCWNAAASEHDHPDCITFALSPDPG
ncbi:non-homologous end-joining DNA ligase LigD [Paraburkholderia strydomiana]